MIKTPLSCFIFLTICATTLAVVGTQSLKLDGKDYIEMKDSHLLNTILTNITVEMRVRVSSFTNEWMPILYKGDGMSPGWMERSYTFWINRSGSVHFASAPQRRPQITLDSAPGSIRLNRWYHIAGVIDTNTRQMILYLNGIVVGKTYYRGKIHQSKRPLRIGWAHENNFGYGFFRGRIDEVRIWNIVRTGDEIRQNCRKPLTGKEKGLVGYWPFDDSTAKDQTLSKTDGAFKQGAPRPMRRFTSTGRMWSFRDIGGIKTADGKRLEEEQIYLSSIPPRDAVLDMVEDGRIRTVINFLMRWEGRFQRYKWRKNDKLNVVHLPYGWTKDPRQWSRDWVSRQSEIVGQLVTQYSTPIKGAFAILADKKNYPVMYYCRGGGDRSIIVTGILYLALGVSEEEMFSGDGQFGALHRGHHEQYILRTALSYVNKAGGIKKYLKYIGVPDEHVERFKQNMLR